MQVSHISGHTPLDHAQAYAALGIVPIPYPQREKFPMREKWQDERPTRDELPGLFPNGVNVGIQNGEPSKNTVDIDLDAPEALAAWPTFAPETGVKWGRQSKPMSHWLYRLTDGPRAATKWQDPTKSDDDASAMLLEYRAGTEAAHGQSMAPPSVHPSGERVRFDCWEYIAEVEHAKLIRACELTAVTALLARRWPGKGSRNEFALKVAGALTSVLDPDTAETIIRTAASVAGDEDAVARGHTVGSTVAKRAAGGQVTGWPALTDELDKKTVAALRAWTHATSRGSAPASEVGGRKLAKVSLDDHLRNTVDASTAALLTGNNPPVLFARGGELVQTMQDENDQEHIRPVSAGAMAVMLSRRADYVRGTGARESKAIPPKPVVEGVLAESARRFPPLTYITASPILRPDGSIHAERGYDPVTRAFYAPAGDLGHFDIPERPSLDDVNTAVALLDDVICDFSFEDEASKAHAYALILTPNIRALFEGPSPLILVDKPTPGSGAGILTDVAALIATGRTARVTTYTNDDAELRKRITALLSGGYQFVLFDNIDVPLRSGELSAVLTARYWADRVLGFGKMGEWPNLATWCGTGNNIRVGGDLPRRIVLIRLNPRVARPWARPQSDFKHPHLIRFVTEHRGELLAAALTLCRAWILAGRPAVEVRPLGSFEGWAATVGGILAFAGVRGFLDNLAKFWEDADENAAKWETFLDHWSSVLGPAPRTAADLAESLTIARDSWGDTLPDWPGEDKLGLAKRVGYGLRANRDRRFGRYTLKRVSVKADGHDKVARWAVEIAAPSPASPAHHPHHHPHHPLFNLKTVRVMATPRPSNPRQTGASPPSSTCRP